MTAASDRVTTATCEVAASAATLFELIADPARQPEWDGNDNLAESKPGSRVRAVGEVFDTVLTNGQVRSNHIVEFIEGQRIAWRPSLVGQDPIGHLWRWELDSIGTDRTRVVHTYDWTDLHDEQRIERARWTTPDRLLGSIDRLAALAETR